MEFTFVDKEVVDKHSLTSAYSIEEYIYPNMKTGFELFGMHVRSVNKEWHYPAHEHSTYEMNLVIEGSQTFHIGGESYDQREGDLILSRPGELHSSKSGHGQPFTYFCFHFNIDDKLFLPYLTDTMAYYPAESKLAISCRPYLDRLIEVAKNSKFSLQERMYVHTIMFELLGSLINALTERKDFQKLTNRNINLAYQIAEKIEGLVKRDNMTDIEHNGGIDDIASELNFSPSYCNKVFKKVYNMSPRQYLSFKKLNVSKTLLTKKEHSIEQVGYLMGYHDIAHFSRQFKRWTGLTPSQYRNANGTNE